MGTHTRPARLGKCNGYLWLIVGRLDCDRETEHPGSHRDDTQGVYWIETAPALEYLEVGPPATVNPPAAGVVYIPEPKREPLRPTVPASQYPPGTRWMSEDNSVWEIDWDDQDKRYTWLRVRDNENGSTR